MAIRFTPGEAQDGGHSQVSTARAIGVVVGSQSIGAPMLVASRGAASTELTYELVRELLDYDPATGLLIWRRRDRRWFNTDHAWRGWNTRYAEQPSGTLTDGYLNVSLCDQLFRAHRVIFLWMTGRWPEPAVDHDNHHGTDNRWSNLFESTHQQNQRNQSLHKNNTSGRVGVWWSENSSKFVAEIRVDYRKLHLGYFSTFESACAAREAAEREYGFHKRHGERAA